MEERTASAVTVCLNLDLSVGVPVGRFSLVAGTDVRMVCPCPGMMVCPRTGVILVVSGFSNLIEIVVLLHRKTVPRAK